LTIFVQTYIFVTQIEEENENLRLELLACVRLLRENSGYVEDSEQSSGGVRFTRSLGWH
jgi:hypothetical protein